MSEIGCRISGELDIGGHRTLVLLDGYALDWVLWIGDTKVKVTPEQGRRILSRILPKHQKEA